jgi:hypothetical protein
LKAGSSVLSNEGSLNLAHVVTFVFFRNVSCGPRDLKHWPDIVSIEIDTGRSVADRRLWKQNGVDRNAGRVKMKNRCYGLLPLAKHWKLLH